MSTARRTGAAAAVITLAASGAYVFVYLYRWEWNRALVSGVIFIATEIGVMTWLLADRIRRVEHRLDRADEEAERRRLEVLRATAPPARTGFGWLARPDQMSVFIPVLLGAGALMSGLAWVVERIARGTAGRVAERGLASRLGALELPSGSLLDGGQDPFALLRGPAGAGR